MAASGPMSAGSPATAADVARLLTVVITTSPTPSAPCTDLLSAVLASFRAHCPALLACPVTVVFDTYDRVVPRARLKKGGVTAKEAQSYAAYKDNVQQLVAEAWGLRQPASSFAVTTGHAEYGLPHIADNAVAFQTARSADGRVAFVEPAMRLGFGLAVRTAVRAATTPYVWIQQHDWTLTADIPLAAMLEVMQASEGGEGEGEEDDDEKEEEEENDDENDEEDDSKVEDDASSSSTEQDIARLAGPDVLEPYSPLLDETVPVRYVCLPSVRMLRYATSPHVVRFSTLRFLTAQLKRDFATQAPVSAGGSHRLPMTPLFFWHDKTHIASTAHYLERVFASRLALGRGDFIEDHIGQRARTQMKNDAASWRRWACWLYYPDDGNELCLRHLQGRTWRGEDREREMRDMYRERNRSAASAAAEAARLAAARTTAVKVWPETAAGPQEFLGVFDSD